MEEKIFKRYGIEKELIKLLLKRNFKRLVKVQEKAIPCSLEGKDLIIASPTGTGKTIAYLVRVVQGTIKDNRLQSVIILPTKELAHQIAEELNFFSSYKNLSVVTIYGNQKSTSYKKELIESSEILVSTPGILLKYIEEFNLDISNINLLVLDEADALLGEHFIKSVEKIILTLKRKRQSIFVSATISKDMMKRINKYSKNPVKILTGTKISNKNIKNYFYEIESNKKLSLLIYLLKKESIGRAIIFTNRTQTAKFVWQKIKKMNYSVALLNGELSKGKRRRILQEFQQNKYDILVSTDIASRGLDFEDISHIINYNIPVEPDKYVHRIGRTARMYGKGVIINLISKTDVKRFLEILSTKGIKVVPRKIENLNLLEERMEN